VLQVDVLLSAPIVTFNISSSDVEVGELEQIQLYKGFIGMLNTGVESESPENEQLKTHL
jgi:hypothetical protein